jgi:hypothetical protein
VLPPVPPPPEPPFDPASPPFAGALVVAPPEPNVPLPPPSARGPLAAGVEQAVSPTIAVTANAMIETRPRDRVMLAG